ncbi:MAG: ABC transporter permease [Armatimonadetes bacterium]|nr:ABC transporter permease [Armatimonadota bacterium]
MRGGLTITPNTLGFLLTQAWSAIRRNGLLTLASVSNIAVSLAILGGMFLSALNLERMARMEAEKAVITVELKEDAKDSEVEVAVWQDPRVGDVTYVTKEENLRAIFERYVPNPEAVALIGENPLPDALRVKPAAPEDIKPLAASLEKLKGVEEARYGQQVVEKIMVLARAVQVSGAVLLVLMAFGMMLIVNATIRLTVYARRREIRIMQLVGATNGFIRLPFICEGLFHGLLGGLFSAATVLLVYLEVVRYVDAHLAFIDLLYGTKLLVLFGLGMVLAGALVGATGSAFSLRRYLRLT